MYARTHIQCKKAADRDTAPQLVYQTLRSGGQPLDDATRAFMEPRFGHDFSAVRVHTGAQAAESAQSVSALAYTIGRDVVFGKGQYQPHSDAGRRLLAHELAHVVQQSSGPVSGVPMAQGLAVSEPGDRFEREAEQTADRVMSIASYSASPAVARFGMLSPMMTIQRCGDTPCNCSAEERLAHDMEEMQMQRFAEQPKIPELNYRSAATDEPAKNASDMGNLAGQKNSGDAGTILGIDQRKGFIAHQTIQKVQENSESAANPDMVLQRTIGDQHDLQSPRFAGDPVLEACFDGEHRMTIGESGPAVQKIQQALIDAGIPLPMFGPDGQYGGETAGAVAKFKQNHGITPADGVVGPKTMSALDELDRSGGLTPGTTPEPTTGLPPPSTLPSNACTFNVRYGNERQEFFCEPTSCGGAITFDVLDITARGPGCPPSLAGLEVTEDVVADAGCIQTSPPVTGHFTLDERGRVPVTGATDTYGFCFPKRSVTEEMLIVGSCTKTMTQKVFVGGMLADTRTITFMIRFIPNISDPDFFSCEAIIIRQ